jgi:hypothetical protein
VLLSRHEDGLHFYCAYVPDPAQIPVLVLVFIKQLEPVSALLHFGLNAAHDIFHLPVARGEHLRAESNSFDFAAVLALELCL